MAEPSIARSLSAVDRYDRTLKALLDTLSNPKWSNQSISIPVPGHGDIEEIIDLHEAVRVLQDLHSVVSHSRLQQQAITSDSDAVAAPSMNRSIGDRYFTLINNISDVQERCSNGTDHGDAGFFLDDQIKPILFRLCLCPPEVEVKKRGLIYWYVGVGVGDGGAVDVQKAAQILDQLVVRGFIEPVVDVTEKKNQSTNRYKMRQHVWSEVRNKHLFPKDSSCSCSCSSWTEEVAVLKKVSAHDKSSPVKPLNIYANSNVVAHWQKNTKILVHTLFNDDKLMLDMNRNWLSGLRDVKVLHLGVRWCHNIKGKHQHDEPRQHIEAKNIIEFLKRVGDLKKVRFLSLQGILGILELPNSVCQLRDLRILDLRACRNLEVLPRKISLLKRLTHLDLSGCYLLDHTPKGVASLTELRVLKGFVICARENHSACAFVNLKELVKLQELYVHTKRKVFPTNEDLNTIGEMEALLKLKILWGGPKRDQEDKSQWPPRTFETKRWEPKLKKLELLAAPQEAVHLMLNPQRLKHLEKLCIKGGHVYDLGQGNVKWQGIKMLHLKFLAYVRMDWRQFLALFPDVTYLEVVQCPKLALFPCDGNGVWEKSEQS